MKEKFKRLGRWTKEHVWMLTSISLGVIAAISRDWTLMGAWICCALSERERVNLLRMIAYQREEPVEVSIKVVKLPEA